MRHELLTQRAFFKNWSQSMQQKGTLSQHFVICVLPPLGIPPPPPPLIPEVDKCDQLM